MIHLVAEALGVVLLIRYQGDIPPAFDPHAHFRKDTGLVVNPAHGVGRRLSLDDGSAKPAHDFDPQHARSGHHRSHREHFSRFRLGHQESEASSTGDASLPAGGATVKLAHAAE